jgi:1,2-diacylglycerol 3-alpha-glucosyltransferase
VAHLGRKLASTLDVPIVMTSHTDYAQYAFGRFSRKKPVYVFTKLLGKFVYRNTEAVIVPSEKAVSFSQLASVRDHVVVIPNGIHLEQYQKQMSEDERKQLFSELNLVDNGKIMLVVSRISKEKNIDEIISYLPYVLKKDLDVRLVVVGDGPYKETLESLSKNLNLDSYVRFVGFIKPEFVYRYYDIGNVFVSGSTFEVHSLTYLEALSHGLPLVCRRDPCLKGVLDDGKNGFAYLTRNEFVDGVLSILNDADRAYDMRLFALEKSNEFGDSAFVNNTIALYDKILA